MQLTPSDVLNLVERLDNKTNDQQGKRFYLSLTDADGTLLDRFCLEMPSTENPADDAVSEDSEAVGNRFSNEDLCARLLRTMRHALVWK